MLEPFLHCLKVIIRRKANPFVTDIAKKPLWIVFADVRVLGKQGISLFECIHIFVIAEKAWVQIRLGG